MIDVDTTSTPSASPDPVTTEPVTAARLNLVNAALLACRCGRSVRHKIWRRARARAAAPVVRRPATELCYYRYVFSASSGRWVAGVGEPPAVHDS